VWQETLSHDLNVYSETREDPVRSQVPAKSLEPCMFTDICQEPGVAFLQRHGRFS
jgi:hypothetical protein